MYNCVLIRLKNGMLDFVKGFQDFDDALDASEKMAKEFIPANELKKKLKNNRSDIYYDGISIYVETL